MIRLTALASLGAIVVVGGGTRWTANLQSNGGSKVTGTATVERLEPAPMPTPVSDSMKPAATSSTRASISIKGGTADTETIACGDLRPATIP